MRDVVRLKVEDVAPHGITVDRTTVPRRFYYGMRLAMSEWNSTDVGGKPMLKAALIAGFVAVTAFSPASAGSQDLCMTPI